MEIAGSIALVSGADRGLGKSYARELVARGVSSGDLRSVDELISDAFVEHEVIPGLTPDKAGAKQPDGAALLDDALPAIQLVARHRLGTVGPAGAVRRTASVQRPWQGCFGTTCQWLRSCSE